MNYPFKKIYVTQKWGVNEETYKRFGLEVSFVFMIFRLFRGYTDSVSKNIFRYFKNSIREIVRIITNADIKISRVTFIFIKNPQSSLFTYNWLASFHFSFVKFTRFYINSISSLIKNIKGLAKTLPFTICSRGKQLLPKISLSSICFKPRRKQSIEETCFAFSFFDIMEPFNTFFRTMFSSIWRNGLATETYIGHNRSIS